MLATFRNQLWCCTAWMVTRYRTISTKTFLLINKINADDTSNNFMQQNSPKHATYDHTLHSLITSHNLLRKGGVSSVTARVQRRGFPAAVGAGSIEVDSDRFKTTSATARAKTWYSISSLPNTTFDSKEGKGAPFERLDVTETSVPSFFNWVTTTKSRSQKLATMTSILRPS